MKRSLLTISLLLLGFLSFSQKKIFYVANQKGEMIEDAFVYSFDNSFSTISDIKGSFIIPDSLKSDTLFIQHPNYHTRKIFDIDNITNSIVLKEKLINFEEVIISANKTKQLSKEVPNQTTLIDEQLITKAEAVTAADLLQSNGSAYVQKSQVGGGSPVLRGFEANKVLLVFDGLRMNNAIYRSGHLQNAISVDQNTLAATEVLYGPGSVIYGSDALGGIVHYITKKPNISSDSETDYQSNYLMRISTANNERTAHIDFIMSMKKWAIFNSITHSSFGNFTAGRNSINEYRNLSKQYYHFQRNDNIDAMVENIDSFKHYNSGYTQLNVMQKYVFRPSNKVKHSFKIYYNTSSNIGRQDRMNDLIRDELKFAQWEYGPQEWTLLHYQFEKEKINRKWADNYKHSLAYQNLIEQRIVRRFNDFERRTRTEDIDVISYNFDLKKSFKNNLLSYGFDLHYNHLNSKSITENIQTNAIGSAITRYPNNGSSYLSSSFYSYYKINKSNKWNAHLGLRFNSNFAELNFKEDEAFNYDTTITHQSNALTGVIGFNKHFTNRSTAKLLLSSGYRAPNIDDLGKIFDTNDGSVVVPNGDLSPEYLYNGELSFSHKLSNKFKTELGYFHSYILNVIVRKDYHFNGQTSINYDGEQLNVEANQNSDLGRINGLFFAIKGQLTDNISLKGNYTITEGIDLTNNEPLAHIPPHYATTGLDYHLEKSSHSLSVIYNGWKKIEDFGPGSTDKPEEATVDGSPMWYIFNYQFSFELYENLKMNIRVDNLFDQAYKPFASGVPGIGRNFRVTLRSQF